MSFADSNRRALLVLLLAAFVFVAFVFRPLAEALFLAGVLSMVLAPLHVRLTRAFRGREGLSAGLLTVCVLLLILGPLVGISAFLVKEGLEAGQYLGETVRSHGAMELVARLPEPLEGWVRGALEHLPEGQSLLDTVEEGVKQAGTGTAAAVGAAVSATGSLLFQGTMMLLALFFFLTNRESILTFVDDASPLRRGQTRELIAEFRDVCKAVVVSSGVTAGVQALAALVGFFIARVPYPLFFGAVTFFFALIPAVGGAAVCLVAAALLLATGHPFAALFLAIWALVVVGLIDNVVKPLIIKGGVHMHGAVVFFSLLGGLAAFGTVGLVLGPVAVALFLALLRIYQRDFAPDPRDRAAMRERPPGGSEGPGGDEGGEPEEPQLHA